MANKKQTSPAVAGVASGVLRDPKENKKSTAGSALAQTPEKPKAKAKKKSKKKSRGK